MGAGEEADVEVEYDWGVREGGAWRGEGVIRLLDPLLLGGEGRCGE